MHTSRIRTKPPHRAGHSLPSKDRANRVLRAAPRISLKSSGKPSNPQVAWPSVSEIAWGLASDKTAIILAVALITMTVLSAGPLHPIDNFVNTAPRPYWDEIRQFLILWPDTVASRAVALPVLTATTFQLAYWHRSWRPVVLGVGGVFGMVCLVASMKLLLARNHPRTYDPVFFGDQGGVSFPSGHGANATLIYGLVLFLLIRYRAVRPHIVRRLGYCIVGIAILQSMVSAYLHFHWFTDLVTGMIAGGFALALTIRLDRMIPEGRTTNWWPWYGRAPETSEERAPRSEYAARD
ncbi:phosphatase PAP2 family protein [Nocardiopsis gilva YIM 90087]|uniref:Phosphatase PAP2 family protein n=1 Tax=Nocardiopsis gilva YIM 90087 TaxID=1235441 RepID=A0A223SD06_9ACTN|nr:phosphatase PAP2 family protein [Nocardiopsis gilva YIM 90087]